MDTANLGANVGQWFEMGQRAGGRLSGVGQSLKVLIDTLNQDKALKQEMGSQKELLRYKAELEKANRSPLENLIDTGKVMDALTKMDVAGIDISGVMKTGTPQGTVGLGSPQVTPTGQANVNGDYEFIPEMVPTLFGGNRIKSYKTEPTESKKTREKINETIASEYAKPYSDVEASVISKAKVIPDEIDKLISLIGEEKSGKTGPTANIYGPSLWSGANRISAFLRPSAGNFVSPLDNMRRAMTFGKGREAGLLLQKIRVLAFGEGGKTLTPLEADTILGSIDPTHKTEQQWIDGLKYAKNVIQSKAAMMKKKVPMSLRGKVEEVPSANQIGRFTIEVE